MQKKAELDPVGIGIVRTMSEFGARAILRQAGFPLRGRRG